MPPNHERQCADASRAAGEPMGGTAPVERAFLCIEQPPPWGRDAVRESGLDPVLVDELLARAGQAGVRVLLVRPAANGRPARRRALLASAGPNPFLVEHGLASVDELLELDLDALARGERPNVGTLRAEPQFLVCTNGRRDACCARYGRVAASALAGRLPNDAWESSHLGGHRFAATMLALPSGFCFGRLDEGSVVAAAEALRRGELLLGSLRGRAGQHPALQAAEIAVRSRLDLRGVDDVRPVSLDPAGHATLMVRREPMSLSMTERGLDSPVTPSCGKEPEPGSAWVPVEG